MSLHASEIEKVLEEIPWENSHIETVQSSGWNRYGFKGFGPRGVWHLFLCLEAPYIRISIPKNPGGWQRKTHRFVSLLRSELIGASVVTLKQWGLERLILIEFETQKGREKLWVRLWTGAANMFLTREDNTIIDAAFLRPRRGEAPGVKLIPPEFQEKPQALPREWEGSGTYAQRLDEAFCLLESKRKIQNAYERYSAWVRGQINALTVKIENLLAQKNLDGVQEKYYGDLLMGSLNLVPAQASSIELEGWEGETVRLKLEPLKSPLENAQAFYLKSKKLRERNSRVDGEIITVEKSLLSLRHDEDRLRTEPEGEWLFLKLKEIQKLPGTSGETQTGLRFQSGAYPLLVGRNAQENEALLRGPIRGRDHWLHTRDVPGGFVFIRQTGVIPVPLEILLDAGQLAVYYSKARGKGKTDVYWTQVKYLRRVKNGPPGRVIPTQEKNLTINPDPERLKRLMEGEL